MLQTSDGMAVGTAGPTGVISLVSAERPSGLLLCAVPSSPRLSLSDGFLLRLLRRCAASRKRLPAAFNFAM